MKNYIKLHEFTKKIHKMMYVRIDINNNYKI